MPDTGTGEWPYPASSVAPDVPADLLLLAQRLAFMLDPVATISALPVSGEYTGQIRTVTAVPGAWFTWSGVAWVMQGAGHFADATARGNAISSPVQGMRTVLATDPSYEWVYLGAYNGTTNKPGANPAGWYPTDGSQVAAAIKNSSSAAIAVLTVVDVPNLSATGVAPGTPVIFEIDLNVTNAGSGADRLILIQGYVDGVAVGVNMSFVIPFLSGQSPDTSLVWRHTFTPTAGAHTFAAKAQVSAASTMAISLGSMSIRAVTPRS